METLACNFALKSISPNEIPPVIFFQEIFSASLLLDHGIDDIGVCRGDVDVQTPLPAERFPTMLKY